MQYVNKISMGIKASDRWLSFQEAELGHWVFMGRTFSGQEKQKGLKALSEARRNQYLQDEANFPTFCIFNETAVYRRDRI